MRASRKKEIDWGGVGNLICELLVKVRTNRTFFARAAKARKATVDQLTAAAITEAVRVEIEGPEEPRNGMGR